jgi:phage-related protein
MVLYKLEVFCSDMKFKMAATAGLSLTIGPYGENVSKRFFSETTWTIEIKLPRNDHWKVLYKDFVLCRSEIQDGHHHRT